MGFKVSFEDDKVPVIVRKKGRKRDRVHWSRNQWTLFDR